jgi:hypothetical protein
VSDEIKTMFDNVGFDKMTDEQRRAFADGFASLLLAKVLPALSDEEFQDMTKSVISEGLGVPKENITG